MIGIWKMLLRAIVKLPGVPAGATTPHLACPTTIERLA